MSKQLPAYHRVERHCSCPGFPDGYDSHDEQYWGVESDCNCRCDTCHFPLDECNCWENCNCCRLPIAGCICTLKVKIPNMSTFKVPLSTPAEKVEALVRKKLKNTKYTTLSCLIGSVVIFNDDFCWLSKLGTIARDEDIAIVKFS